MATVPFFHTYNPSQQSFSTTPVTMATLSGVLTHGNQYLFIAHGEIISYNSYSLIDFRLGTSNSTEYSIYRTSSTTLSAQFFSAFVGTYIAGVNPTLAAYRTLAVGAATNNVTNATVMAIDLSTLTQNTDWFYNSQSGLSSINGWTSKIGQNFTPDGHSNYMVLASGHCQQANASNIVNYRARMRIRDTTSGVSLSEQSKREYAATNLAVRYAMSGLWVLESPPPSSKTLTVDWEGGTYWWSRAAKIFILRLNAFTIHDFVQQVFNNSFGDTAEHSLGVANYTSSLVTHLALSRGVMEGSSSANFAALRQKTSGATRQTHVISPYSGREAGFSTHRHFGTNPSAEATLQMGQSSLVAKEACTVLLANDTPAITGFTPVVSSFSPTGSGVAQDANITFDITTTLGNVDQDSLNVEVQVNSVSYSAIDNGQFVLPFAGSISSITNGFGVVIDYAGLFPVGGSVLIKVNARSDTQRPMTQYNNSFFVTLIDVIEGVNLEQIQSGENLEDD